MDNLEQIKQIDWWYVLLAIILALVCLKFIWSLLDWLLFEKLGIETRKMKQKREDKEVLLATTELAKKTAENLNKLQERHCQDELEFRNNLNAYMEESRADRKALHDEMNKFTENRISDRQQSIQIQKELLDSLQTISDKVDTMQKNTDERFIASEEKQNQRVQSDIKERIAQSYRRYDKLKKITHMELEALEDLIATYEAHGGVNSFVHTVVQKEMYTWEVCNSYENE